MEIVDPKKNFLKKFKVPWWFDRYPGMFDIVVINKTGGVSPDAFNA